MNPRPTELAQFNGKELARLEEIKTDLSKLSERFPGTILPRSLLEYLAIQQLKIEKKMEELAKEAGRDTLCQTLLNRTSFETNVDEKLKLAIRPLHAEQAKGIEGGFLFLDLDLFKEINDQWGHQVGDLVLLDTADYLTAVVRTGDLVSRQGGDEFVLYLDSTIARDKRDPLKNLLIPAERIRSGLAAFIHSRRPQLTTLPTVSIGVALAPQEVDYRSLMNDGFRKNLIALNIHEADLTMYRAKQHSRNAIAVRMDTGETQLATIDLARGEYKLTPLE